MTEGRGSRKKTAGKGSAGVLLLIVLCILSLTGMVFALTKGEKQTAVFSPPPFDKNAQSGTPAPEEETGYSQVNAEAYLFSVCGAPQISGNALLVYLTDPKDSTVWLKVRVLSEEGELLGESGLIRPGEYVEAVQLEEVPREEQQVTLKVMGYEPETYHSAGSVELTTEVRKP